MRNLATFNLFCPNSGKQVFIRPGQIAQAGLLWKENSWRPLEQNYIAKWQQSEKDFEGKSDRFLVLEKFD